MIKYFNKILKWTIPFFVMACTQSLTHEELLEYASSPKNGLIVEKKVNSVTYKLSYLPVELMLHQHIIAKDSLSLEELDRLRENYNQYHHMKLSVSKSGVEALKTFSNFSEYSRTMQNMGFGFDRFVLLTTQERDTLNLVDSHFIRYFGMGKSNDIMLIFEKEKRKTKSLIFAINEFGLKTGRTTIKLESRAIKKLNKKRLNLKSYK